MSRTVLAIQQQIHHTNPFPYPSNAFLKYYSHEWLDLNIPIMKLSQSNNQTSKNQHLGIITPNSAVSKERILDVLLLPRLQLELNQILLLLPFQSIALLPSRPLLPLHILRFPHTLVLPPQLPAPALSPVLLTTQGKFTVYVRFSIQREELFRNVDVLLRKVNTLRDGKRLVEIDRQTTSLTRLLRFQVRPQQIRLKLPQIFAPIPYPVPLPTDIKLPTLLLLNRGTLGPQYAPKPLRHPPTPLHPAPIPLLNHLPILHKETIRASSPEGPLLLQSQGYPLRLKETTRNRFSNACATQI